MPHPMLKYSELRCKKKYNKVIYLINYVIIIYGGQMYKRITQIYKDRLIEPKADNFPLSYYYFVNDSGQLFGIEKTISPNEYALLRIIYPEKLINYPDKRQRIFEFLLEEGAYPFDQKRGRLLLYRTKQAVEQEKINNVLEDLLQDIACIDYLGWQIVFYFTSFETELGPVFQAMSEDFGLPLQAHLGIFFDEATPGCDLVAYVKAFIASFPFLSQSFSQMTDLVFRLNPKSDVIPIIRKNALKSILHKPESVDILNAFFKNNLNISKSAKALYLHRNSLINKLDNIQKELGLNLQDFRTASAVFFLLNAVDTQE